jgi:ABC-type branched-subunit amino acid transport system ATPase component
MSATVLSLRGATKRFGGLVAVNGIDSTWPSTRSWA